MGLFGYLYNNDLVICKDNCQYYYMYVWIVCRCEMSYFGIRTSIIEPGTFFTNINDFTKFKENAQKNIDSLSNDLKKQYGKAYMDRSKL